VSSVLAVPTPIRLYYSTRGSITALQELGKNERKMIKEYP